jgi:hypothetical protein
MKGFSKRFVKLVVESGLLLDMDKPLSKISYTKGSKVFGVSINTFRNWCVKDVPPRKSEYLQDIVKEIMVCFDVHESELDIVVNHACAYLLFGVKTDRLIEAMECR